MDLSYSSSFVRVPSLVDHHKSYSPNKTIPTKSNSKCSNKFTSIGLYYNQHYRNHSKPVSTRHRHSHISIWARRQTLVADGEYETEPSLNQVSQFIDAFLRFVRPYAMYGTILTFVAMVTRALVENPDLIRWSLLMKSLQAFISLLALLCGNAYTVGINQIYDVEIDKINKPYLPIAAGDISVQTASVLVISFGLIGLLIVGLTCGPFLTSVYCFTLFLGTIYSAPPIRIKRFPVGAFFLISAMRGFLLNFGVSYASRAGLGLAFEWSPPVIFMTTFVTLVASVIALTKDLPDVEGDRKFQIPTLATKFGVRNIAFLGAGILLAEYIGSILAAVFMPQAFRRIVMIPAHTILALSLIFKVRELEQANYKKEALTAFYQFIWNLYRAEFIIFPFI